MLNCLAFQLINLPVQSKIFLSTLRWSSQFSCYLNRLFNNTTHCIILIGHSLNEEMNNIKLNIETQAVHLEEVRFSEEEILLLKD